LGTMLTENRYYKNNMETFFDSILDVLSDGIYISDNTGNTLKINRRYEQLTGLTREEMLGRLVTDLRTAGKYDVILNPEIVRTGEPRTSVQITKAGRKVILNGYPVFDEAGQVALVVTFVRDVTLLSQLKEQLAYQQELIDHYQNEVQYFTEKNAHNSTVIIKSPSMARLMNKLHIIAKTDATVMLLGETGVGKDILARKIHENSLRCKRPFFKIDCTTIPENLFESNYLVMRPVLFPELM
jgi:PAS domain S-box-containing protein